MRAIPFAYTPGRAARTRRRLTTFQRLLLILQEWHFRHRSRVKLASLDDRMLRDIGITRTEALQEAGKPFWRA